MKMLAGLVPLAAIEILRPAPSDGPCGVTQGRIVVPGAQRPPQGDQQHAREHAHDTSHGDQKPKSMARALQRGTEAEGGAMAARTPRGAAPRCEAASWALRRGREGRASEVAVGGGARS